MSALVMLSLLGLAMLAPVFMGDDDDAAPDTADQTPDPQDDAPTPAVMPVEDDEAPLAPATATLDAQSNTVTITTDPDETGTVYLVANRINAVDDDGMDSFVYEATALLVPEGIDLADAFDAEQEVGNSAFYFDLLGNIGATQLGYFPFDPDAAADEPDAFPDFEYPEAITPEFIQLYTINFGDGGQIEEILDVQSEEALTENITERQTGFRLDLLENRSGAFVTLPDRLDASIAVFETTTDYFFEGALVRSEFDIGISILEAGADFEAGVLPFADQVTQTQTEAGTQYTIADQSLTADEFSSNVTGAQAFGGYGVSNTEFDPWGQPTLSEEFSGTGVSSNAEIIRYVVRATGAALPTGNMEGAAAWSGDTQSVVITSFGQVENTPADLTPETGA